MTGESGPVARQGDPNYDPFYDIAPWPDVDGAILINDVTTVSGQFGETCISSFVYNGDGLRTRREGNWGITWDYVWHVASGLPVILNERDRHNKLDGETAGHGANNTYVYGLDLISATDKDGARSYFLYDGLGGRSG